MGDKQKKDPLQTFKKLFGGKDPTKQKGGQGVLATALQKVQEKRDAANEKVAIDLIEQAIEVRTNIDNVEKEFNGKLNKFRKGLGEVLKKIEQFAGGQEAPQESESAESGSGEGDSAPE